MSLGLREPGGALAVDFRGRPIGAPLGGILRPVAGLFVEGAAATDWRVSTSAKLGVALASASSGREIGIALIAPAAHLF